MMIHVTCQCGKSYDVPDEWSGKKAKCKSCGASLDVAQVVAANTANSSNAFRRGIHWAKGVLFATFLVATIVVGGLTTLVHFIGEARTKATRIAEEGNERNSVQLDVTLRSIATERVLLNSEIPPGSQCTVTLIMPHGISKNNWLVVGEVTYPKPVRYMAGTSFCVMATVGSGGRIVVSHVWIGADEVVAVLDQWPR